VRPHYRPNVVGRPVEMHAITARLIGGTGTCSWRAELKIFLISNTYCASAHHVDRRDIMFSTHLCECACVADEGILRPTCRRLLVTVDRCNRDPDYPMGCVHAVTLLYCG